MVAPVGTPFLVDQDSTIEKRKEWVGLLKAPGGYKITEHYSQDFIKKELLYSGKSGNTIEFAYREYRGGLAATPFYQQLKYDLSKSDVVTFQNFKIKVLKADNQSITYKILSDCKLMIRWHTGLRIKEFNSGRMIYMHHLRIM